MKRNEHECPDCTTKNHYRERQEWGETADKDVIVRECMICGSKWWVACVAYPKSADGLSVRD
jgi:hypothetical protein